MSSQGSCRRDRVDCDCEDLDFRSVSHLDLAPTLSKKCLCLGGIHWEFPVTRIMAGFFIIVGFIVVVGWLICCCKTFGKDNGEVGPVHHSPVQQPAANVDVAKEKQPVKMKRIKNLAEGVSVQYLLGFFYSVSTLTPSSLSSRRMTGARPK